jgi:hypothetical protein
MRRWLFVGSVFFVLAAPAVAAQPAWKGLINDWYDGHIDRTWPCSAYRTALKRLPESTTSYSTAAEDFRQNLREGKCSGEKAVYGALWIGPKSGGHADRWPYIAGAAALLLGAATALGLHRARRPTRS